MSKNVDKVKEVIKAHLDAMAQKDACFAERYANHDKNIDECMDYILGEARKRGRTVYMSDQEVFGMAAHYYEEDGIKVSKLPSSVKATATLNDDPAELTDEEKANETTSDRTETQRNSAMGGSVPEGKGTVLWIMLRRRQCVCQGHTICGRDGGRR